MLGRGAAVSAAGMVVGWSVLVLGVVPETSSVLPSTAVLMGAVVASVSTTSAVIRDLMRPPREAFDAGRSYERRQMLREMNEPGKVIDLHHHGQGRNRERDQKDRGRGA